MVNKVFPDPSPSAFSFHFNLPNYILESRTLAITKQSVCSLRERTCIQYGTSSAVVTVLYTLYYSGGVTCCAGPVARSDRSPLFYQLTLYFSPIKMPSRFITPYNGFSALLNVERHLTDTRLDLSGNINSLTIFLISKLSSFTLKI